MMWFKQARQAAAQWLSSAPWVAFAKWVLCIIFGTVLPLLGLGMMFKGLESFHIGAGMVVVGAILLVYAYFVARVIPLPWK